MKNAKLTSNSHLSFHGICAILFVVFIILGMASYQRGGSVNFKLATSATVKVLAYSAEEGKPVLTKGSGAIVDPKGWIVTNNHIVAGYDTVLVHLANDGDYPAQIVFQDPTTDLAVLKVSGPELPYFRFGNSAHLALGETVYAIGCPGKLDFSITNGIVGGFNRQINAIPHPARVERFIQTSVPCNPGCSGGPLINQKGELVGINTAIVTETGRFEGYSFAVPGELVAECLEQARTEKNSLAPGHNYNTTGIYSQTKIKN